MNYEYYNSLNHDNPNGLQIINDEINEKVCPTKHSIFTRYKNNFSIFIETGTHLGGGIANALGAGFSEIYSVEIMEEHYEYAKNRWKDKSNVHLYLGDGFEKLKDIIDKIDEPVFFWLDSHFHNSDPTYKELEIIKNHKIKTHTILIDDIPLYFNKSNIEQIILQINPNYKISYEPTIHGIDGILIAKI